MKNSMIRDEFSWVQTHKELTAYLKDKQGDQKGLIALLKSVGISPFNDKTSAGGHDTELDEIDPFTFFCYINKYGSDRRLALLQAIAGKINISIPKGEGGIPTANAQSVWLFPYKFSRTNNEIDRLWSFFYKAVSGAIKDEDFEDILNIKSVGAVKLTEALFYINPDAFLPINKPTIHYIEDVLGLNSKFDTYTGYTELLEAVKRRVALPFYELSYEAWKWHNEPGNEINYWIFQGNPKIYDLETALREQVLNDWAISAHKDKIKVGDKVIIWITGKDSGCYALAKITFPPREETSSAGDHLWMDKKESELKAGIAITHNLIDRPILKFQIDSEKELRNLKVGLQGTNFSSTEREFQTLLKIVENMDSKRKYWIYAPGKNASKWQEFYEQGVMGLGWDELEDLNQYATKEEIAKRLQEIHKTDKSKKNDATANYAFKNDISIGDIIIAKRGRSEYIGYGVVLSDYFYAPNQSDYKSLRKVDWKKKGVWEDANHPIVLKTLTDITKYPDYVARLLSMLGIEQTDKPLQTIKVPLNQILFGPPGTGKTYHTVNEALRVIGEDVSGSTRTQIKEAFDKKIKEGQIVFTTFHQSMSYEEFIEGIKPIEPEKDGDEVIYRVEPGLFKKLSVEASFDIAKHRKSKETAEALDFSNLYDLFIEEVQEKLINGEDIELKTKSGGTVLIDSISQQGNIIIKHNNGTRTYTVSKARLTKLQTAIGSLDNVSNINDEFREIIGGSNSSAYWSVLNAIKQITKRVNGNVEEKAYTYSDKVEVIKKMTKEDFNSSQGKNYVLIIDEINRGNVSQIFGELITLIEEDKRMGQGEALEVTLPYSKEKFGVPPNLYIIGTMNTADRSVEALDTALRRRFSFREMPPRYDLEDLDYEFAGVKGSEILKTINRRIEKLLDRDHLIGHSYFLLNEKEHQRLRVKLLDSFYRNIIPLLQEYFFGDYAKIGAVLGNGFVYAENENDQAVFASGYENEDFAEKDVYHIIDYRLNQPDKPYIQPPMNFEKAIRLLMNKKVEQESES